MRILEVLKIDQRATKGDGPVEFKFFPNLPDTLSFFKNENPRFPNPKDSSVFFYPNPIIGLSKAVKDAGFDNDTTKLSRIYALSIIIHEFAHYYSKERITMEAPNVLKERGIDAYRQVGTEKTAHAVGAYFYLEKLYPKMCKEIMSSKKNILEKRQALTDLYQKVTN